MKKIRILVVDDENVIREGFVTMLRLQQDMQVVGEGMDGLQAVTLARKTQPDVVLLDMQMPKQDGLTTIPKLVEVAPKCSILVLTGYADHDKVYQAMKSGALGLLAQGHNPRAAGPGHPRRGRRQALHPAIDCGQGDPGDRSSDAQPSDRRSRWRRGSWTRCG